MATSDSKPWFDTPEQAWDKGARPVLRALAAVWGLSFALLALVCLLRREPPDPSWLCQWLRPAGSVWNLLVLAPAGTAAGCLVGFVSASYGREREGISSLLKTVPIFAGGAVVVDLGRGGEGVTAALLAGLAAVTGPGTGSPLVALILLWFFVIGFLVLYLVKATLINGAVLHGSRELLSPVDTAKAATEGVARKPGAEAARAKVSPDRAQPRAAQAAGDRLDPADPQKGRWGGQRVSGGYELDASVEPVAGSAEYFRVKMVVRAVEGGGMIKKPVTFHLHPTFSQPVVTVRPVGGVVTLERLAWGAFTVGVQIGADGPTLELDLASLEDAPAVFRGR